MKSFVSINYIFQSISSNYKQQNKVWKTRRLACIQILQSWSLSVPIFFKFVHPFLPLYLLCYPYPSFNVLSGYFYISQNLAAALTVLRFWILINFVTTFIFMVRKQRLFQFCDNISHQKDPESGNTCTVLKTQKTPSQSHSRRQLYSLSPQSPSASNSFKKSGVHSGLTAVSFGMTKWGLF